MLHFQLTSLVSQFWLLKSALSYCAIFLYYICTFVFSEWRHISNWSSDSGLLSVPTDMVSYFVQSKLFFIHFSADIAKANITKVTVKPPPQPPPPPPKKNLQWTLLTSIGNSHSTHRQTSDINIFDRQKFKSTVIHVCGSEFGEHIARVRPSYAKTGHIICHIFNSYVVISIPCMFQ